MDNECVACGATPNFAAGGCDYHPGGKDELSSKDGWHKCEYSQHLLPGYACPTGGLAPNGYALPHRHLGESRRDPDRQCNCTDPGLPI